MTTFFSLNDLGLASSPGELLTQWLSYMSTVFPGYTPSAGNLEYIMAVVFASWAAEVNAQASRGSAELFKEFGQQLIGVLPENGSPATTDVTVTAIDSAGYTLPIGTQFLLDNAYGFSSAAPLMIPAGSQSGTVLVQAITSGAASNGAGSIGAALNQQLNWVLSVGLSSPASGGADPETEEAYLNRLATELTLMAPRPITASDYGTFALSFQPAFGTDQQEVGRATAIDGYDPGTNTYNNEREVAVCVVDANGNSLNQDTMTAIQTWLSGLRELNFIVNVLAPNYSPIYVQCQVFRNVAYDRTTVQTNIQTALEDLLSPSTWGAPPSGGIGWTNQQTLFYSQIEAAVQEASGVDHVVFGSLGVGFQANPNGVNDLVLPGPFPLPTTSGGATTPLTAFQVMN